MTRPTMVRTLNGHRLTVMFVGERRYFSCPTMPDLAERYDGATDSTPAFEEFERRAQAAPPPESMPKGPAQGSLFDGLDHDGATFDRELDGARLNAQTRRVYEAMSAGAWRTLAELSAATGDPEASVSARLRDLRKSAFGGHVVERRRRGEGKRGLWEYRLRPPGERAAEGSAA